MANTLLRMFLTLAPPPTFDGRDPSEIVIKIVLEIIVGIPGVIENYVKVFHD